MLGLLALLAPATSAQTRAGGAPARSTPPRSAHAHGQKPNKRLAAQMRSDAARAMAAYQAMQNAYFIPGSGGLYTGEPYSFLWPFSQAFAATVSLYEVPHMARAAVSRYTRETHVRLSGLEKYWGPAGQTLPGQPTEEEEEETEPPEEGDNFVTTMPSFNGNVVPPGGISYYDDNEWVGIELVRLYKRTHEPALLERAEQVMTFVMAGWQTDPKLACPGGIPFSDSPDNTDRNTITDGPAAELGVQLYRITRDPRYLQFAEMAYQWVRTCLLEPSSMYADHIRNQGAVVEKLWSYTQGVMIGAGAMLYQATGNATYLGEARQTARAALAYFTQAHLEEESPFFPSVYFRNVMYLDSITHDPPGRSLAQAYADRAWAHQRTKGNLFVFGTPPASALLSQAAIVQIYALLAEPASSYF
ncbi:MAG: glycoside hydrolase family 76 protein [Solirubrobacteraceae bacterium]